jgi:hypothetical protein
MNKIIRKFILMLVLVVAILAWNADVIPPFHAGFVSTAEAVVGRPATPVSYAGVARRTTVRAGNRGGPVNRVGRR